MSASTSPRPSGLSELPAAHMCVTMRMSILRQVSRATSFEMGLLRKVLSDMGVSVLRPRPCVRGWIMHLLSNIEYVNDMAWTREGQCHDIFYMDTCLGCLDVMNNTWTRSR